MTEPVILHAYLRVESERAFTSRKIDVHNVAGIPVPSKKDQQVVYLCQVDHRPEYCLEEHLGGCRLKFDLTDANAVPALFISLAKELLLQPGSEVACLEGNCRLVSQQSTRKPRGRLVVWCKRFAERDAIDALVMEFLKTRNITPLYKNREPNKETHEPSTLKLLSELELDGIDIDASVSKLRSIAAHMGARGRADYLRIMEQVELVYNDEARQLPQEQTDFELQREKDQSRITIETYWYNVQARELYEALKVVQGALKRTARGNSWAKRDELSAELHDFMLFARRWARTSVCNENARKCSNERMFDMHHHVTDNGDIDVMVSEHINKIHASGRDALACMGKGRHTPEKEVHAMKRVLKRLESEYAAGSFRGHPYNKGVMIISCRGGVTAPTPPCPNIDTFWRLQAPTSVAARPQPACRPNVDAPCWRTTLAAPTSQPVAPAASSGARASPPAPLSFRPPKFNRTARR
jgi:hypothetical protein